ncbi:MAG TPA: hypothetical protein ENK23_01695 [Sorangium sp.]|nr:hypothetical protein [Sorangium sp.]
MQVVRFAFVTADHGGTHHAPLQQPDHTPADPSDRDSHHADGNADPRVSPEMRNLVSASRPTISFAATSENATYFRE